MRKIPTAMVTILTASVCTAAHADVEYLTQARSVGAYASTGSVGGSQTVLQTAPDFSAFARTLTATVGNPSNPFGAWSTSTVYQRSELLPDRITAGGTGSGRFQVNGGSLGGYSSEATQVIDITFHLSEATAYSLNLYYNIDALDSRLGSPAPVTHFELSGPAGFTPYLLSGPAGYGGEVQNLNTSGVMPAGNYHLFLDASVSSAFFGSQGYITEMNMTLIIPSPGTACIGLLAGCALASRRRRAH